VIEYKPVTKKGRIIVSGVTVHGKDTKFLEDCAQGDTLIIRHPETLVKEQRKISIVLSNKSLAVNQEFSSNFCTFIQF
jgi:hypothetical protein